MQEDKILLFREYISNMQVQLLDAAHTKCWADWRDVDYVPDYNKFYFVCDGEGWLKIGDKEYYPKTGQMYLMPAGIKQSYSTISGNTFTKYWCHFRATIGDMNLFEMIQMPAFINVKDDNKLTVLFKDLIYYYNSSSITSMIRVKSILLEIISIFIESAVVEKIHMVNSPAVEKLSCIITYIEKNLDQDLMVSNLAEIIHLHPNYFIKFFKEHIGTTPIAYINHKRLERAKELLKSGRDSISEVAGMAGFKDVFYFSKAFKSYTGYSPSQFRNL